MRIKHVHAKRGEWVKVHRPDSRSGSEKAGEYGWLIKAAIWLAGVYMAFWVFSQIWPFLLLAGVGYAALLMKSER